jgi:hypothetical protein
MKKLLPFLLILITFTSSGQTNGQTAKVVAKPKLSASDIMMCDKEWHAVSIIEWAVEQKPGEKNVNDMLKLSQDGTYNLILFGTAKSGTWTKVGQYIYFVDTTTKEKFNYKVVSVEEKKLKIDYRDPDETHTIFMMEPK